MVWHKSTSALRGSTSLPDCPWLVKKEKILTNELKLGGEWQLTYADLLWLGEVSEAGVAVAGGFRSWWCEWGVGVGWQVFTNADTFVCTLFKEIKLHKVH